MDASQTHASLTKFYHATNWSQPINPLQEERKLTVQASVSREFLQVMSESFIREA
jgi:hypothetical protein